MQNTASFGTVRVLILVAALVTAGVHLFLGVRDLSTPFGLMFILNGLGFLGLAGMYLLPIPFLQPYKSLIRWALIGFAVLTFVLYFVFNGIKLDAVSGITKAAELCLIGLLSSEGRSK